MPRQQFRLTGTSYAVLGLVAYAGEATPYDLKQALQASTEHFWPVPHTTAYAEPARLAAAGYLDERQEERGRRRKTYSLTETGRRALEAWLAAGESSPFVFQDETTLKIFMGADPAPLLEASLRSQRERLAVLEAYAEMARDADGPPGPRRALELGLRFHRALIEMDETSLRDGLD